MRWDELGDGPPIVLVHGTPYSSFLWRDVAPALARRGRRVYVFDHLGYGQSDKRAHEALVTAHLRNGTHQGLNPWLGTDGQAAFYRQYRQLSEDDTAEYEHLLGSIDIPVTLLWGRDDQIRVTNRGLTWIDDAGHLLPEDAPAQLVERLTA